ncbi:hypothetical protein DL768_000886 [Monosporascus sp. mg162]|nr:hypothetical protein DL768_000886 [Monosporascus sp. mg162]
MTKLYNCMAINAQNSATLEGAPGSLLSKLSLSEKERTEKQSPSLANDRPRRLEFIYLIVKERVRTKVGALLFTAMVLAGFLQPKDGTRVKIAKL